MENLKRGEGYIKSKTLAERKAWELVKGTQLQLAVVNPVLIVGPILSDSGGEASQVIVSTPRISCNCVCVCVCMRACVCIRRYI